MRKRSREVCVKLVSKTFKAQLAFAINFCCLNTQNTECSGNNIVLYSMYEYGVTQANDIHM